jgi:hypothetical protein
MDPIFTKYARAGSTFVGCGAAGCGVFPAIPCEGDMDDGDNDQQVSKLFKDGRSFDFELTQYKLFRTLDPEGVYTVRLVKECAVPMSKLSTKIQGEGPFAANQLKYEYGGQTLKALFLQDDPVDFAIVEDILMVQFPKIIGFLILLRNSNTAHNDLHPENIVYSPSKGLRFIDFGMASVDVSGDSEDKTKFKDTMLEVLDAVDDSAAPSSEWALRLDNARAFLQFMYNSMDLEGVQTMWELAMHDTEHTFITQHVKPALLQLAESKQTFRDDSGALAKAKRLVANPAVPLSDFQIFLKQCFLDMVLRTNPCAAQRGAENYKMSGSLVSFVQDPSKSFLTFVAIFGKM